MPSGAYPDTGKYEFVNPRMPRARPQADPARLVADVMVEMQHAQPTTRDIARITGLPTETVERVEDRARALAFRRINQ